MSPLVKRPLFGITVPVHIDGENRYVLARSPDQHALEHPVAAHELPPGWLAVVSDTARRIIARSEQEDAFIGRSCRWHSGIARNAPAYSSLSTPKGDHRCRDTRGRN